MELLKCIAIVGIVMAVRANSTFEYNYDAKFIMVINDVVLLKKSNTCVILVVDGKIKFVSTEGDSPRKLAKFRDSVKNRNLEIIKSSFKPLSATDVIEKLAKIGKAHSTFLVYFQAGTDKSEKGSIITETMKPVGLVGNLLGSLGLKVEEKGLLPMLLSALGLDANEKDVEIIEFEN